MGVVFTVFRCKKFLFDAKMPLKLFFDLLRSFGGHSEVIWGLNQRSLLKKTHGCRFHSFQTREIHFRQQKCLLSFSLTFGGHSEVIWRLNQRSLLKKTPWVSFSQYSDARNSFLKSKISFELFFDSGGPLEVIQR